LIVNDQPTTAETADPEGRRVVLADAVWREKIVRDHPEIDTHMSGLPQAVTKPDHIAADPIFVARTRYYVRGVGPSRWLLVVEAVAQTPEALAAAVLRVGSKYPKVIARPRHVLLCLGSPSAFHGHHSERRPRFRRRLCATATVVSHEQVPARIVSAFANRKDP
jgi:hypothetical protein